MIKLDAGGRLNGSESWEKNGGDVEGPGPLADESMWCRQWKFDVNGR